MFLKDEVAAIIECAALENRLSYNSLTAKERNTLVAHLLHNSDQGLLDADHNLHIQQAVARFILCDGNQESLDGLRIAIDLALLAGDKDNVPHYADEIENRLNEKWCDHNRKPNEHFENDAMQRARDMRDEQRRY